MSSLELRYPILQSGFLSLSSVGLTKQLPSAPSFSDSILFIQTNHEYDNLFYSEDVSKLFTDWQANFHVIRKFEFKEKILEQAMKRFGPAIGEWLAFQGNKPGFTNTHKQFLNKMCAWMNPTYVSPSDSAEAIKWIGLIGPDQGNNVSFNLYDAISKDTVLTTPSILCNWVAKEGGYESLLVFMYIIFGQRVGHTQKPTMTQ